MKKLCFLILSGCIIILNFSNCYGEPTAYQVVDKAYNLEDGDSFKADMTMKIVKTQGWNRTRKLQFFRKDFGEADRTLLKFTAPSDIRDTSLLTWNHEKEKNDQWLYLPALRVIRRIASGSKSDNFMGSHFSYEDFTARSINKDNFKMLETETYQGRDCYVIDVLSKDKTEEYPRRVYYIRKDNYVIVKSLYYNQSEKLEKILKAEKIKKISGYWTALTLKMENIQTKGYTVISLSDPKYNTSLSSRMFRVQALKR